MIEHIQQYYITEKNGAITGIILGAIIIGIALLLWKVIPLTPLTRGLSVGLAIIGTLVFTVTAVYTVTTTQQINRLTQQAARSNAALQNEEIARMKKVFAVTYPMALSVHTLFIAAGIALVMANSTFFWKGIGLSLMVLGTLAFVSEGFSMQANKAYQQKITSLQF